MRAHEDPRTLIGTIARAVNLAPRRFTVAELKPLIEQVNPDIDYEDHSPYSALERLEALGFVRGLNGAGRKTWECIDPIGEQQLLEFDAEAEWPEPLQLDKQRARPGQVQQAVLAIIPRLRGQRFTTRDLREYIVSGFPDTAAAMSKGSVASVLDSLAWKGAVERCGKAGRYTLWRQA